MQMKGNDVICWGLRFSPELVCMKNKERKKCNEMLDKVAGDMQSYGEGNVFTMDAEEKELPYLYLMFLNKEDAEGFYEKHKSEKVYLDGKLRLIKEPAYIPYKCLFPKKKENEA